MAKDHFRSHFGSKGLVGIQCLPFCGSFFATCAMSKRAFARDKGSDVKPVVKVTAADDDSDDDAYGLSASASMDATPADRVFNCDICCINYSSKQVINVGSAQYPKYRGRGCHTSS